jgi:hypothetical protein
VCLVSFGVVLAICGVGLVSFGVILAKLCCLFGVILAIFFFELTA